MAKRVQQQILKTSTSLLGYCFVILVLFCFANRTGNMTPGIFISFTALLLGASAISSIISLRTTDEQKELKIQNIASCLFLSSLAVIFASVIYPLYFSNGRPYLSGTKKTVISCLLIFKAG